jgi:hypothetical protein
MTRAIWLPLLALTVAGCAIGSTVEKAESARSPEGATLRVTTGNTVLEEVELLEVQDSALLVRADTTRVVAVHYSAINNIRAGAFGSFLLNGRPPIAAHERRLRTISRFPQGLSSELLAELLAGMGRSEVEHIR